MKFNMKKSKMIEICVKRSLRRSLQNDYDWNDMFNLLKPTGHVMHQQFNIQQLYVLLTLYLWVLYLSENKQ